MFQPGNIIYVVLLFFLYKFINGTCHQVFGKGFIQILIEIFGQGKTLVEVQKDSIAAGRLRIDNHKLFEKLCQVTNTDPVEMCKIARTEKGFNLLPDKEVERDFDNWMRSYFSEDKIPAYVESFLSDGKDYIINA